MTFHELEVKTYVSFRLPDLKPAGKEFRGPCPVHKGRDPNFSISSETGFASCHSQCGRGWDLISLEQELSGLDFGRAKDRVFDLVGRPRVPWEERNVEAIYNYTDEHGEVLYQVLRYVGKEFKQRRPDGDGWNFGLGDVRRVPFNLPELVPAQFVFVVEGEKDVLTLKSLGVTATCNSGGAGHFKPELVPWFEGKEVCIPPDNDEPGRAHAKKVAELLAPVAKSVKILELPGLPAKGDVTDFVQAGGTLDQIRELYRKAPLWDPSFEFGTSVPSEEEHYVRTFLEDIEAAGGLGPFWDLSVLRGLETPWKELSHAMGGGLRNGEVYIIGGNQGSGKTSLALQFCIAAIRRNECPLVFSMEMGHRDVFQRMAAIEAVVNLKDYRIAQIILKRKDATDDERLLAQDRLKRDTPKLWKAAADLSTLPLLVSTKSSVTTDYITEEVARLQKRQKLSLVVVDHMQLMASTGSERRDYEKFTAISRAMKQTAKELDLPILLVSQTSRAQAKDKRGELEVADLRGSGALEEDAATVMLLYEDVKDAADAKVDGDGSRYTKGPTLAYLKLGKNRYGEQGRSFQLIHTKYATRFDLA